MSHSPTAVAYKTTEEARLLLSGDAPTELIRACTAAGEAAYYLSDTIEPDDRTSLLALAERRREPCPPEVEDSETRAAEALVLLADTAGEVEQMLRGPSASSELRIALRALRRAIGNLASSCGMSTNPLRVNGLRTQRLSMLRKFNGKRR